MRARGLPNRHTFLRDRGVAFSTTGAPPDPGGVLVFERMGRRGVLLAGALAIGVVACRDVRTGHAVSADASARSQPLPRVAPAAAASAAADGGSSLAALCALPLSQSVALDSAQPFAPNYPHCPVTGDPFCDTIDAPPVGGGACFVANQNLARAEREGRNAAGAPAVPSRAWDGVSAPQYLERIDAHFQLTPIEHERLRTNGFVVLDRLAYADYASAFHDVFQEQLPLYVGIDPAMHAVFRGTELVLGRIEEKRLKPALFSLLTKLRARLRTAKPSLAASTAADLDVYLGVALGLARPNLRERGLSLFGNDAEIQQLLGLAERLEMTDPEVGVELFGRSRVIDFSQLKPRGHYLTSGYGPGEGLEGYFGAVMWLSRLEFNLASRSCRSSQPGNTLDPRETPREATDALALAEIAADSGALVELAAFDEVYGAFAGRREDVSPSQLLELARRARIRSTDTDASMKLEAAIGDRFQRTTRVHFMPEGAAVLPAIATLLGPRIVPDTAALVGLVHDRVPGRLELGAADVAYVLGHDGAKRYLQADLQTYPSLQRALDVAREDTRRGARGGDVYASFLRAILAVSEPPTGTVPSFLGREAYQDLRQNSALVGFGALRHAFVLLAAQGYDAYGCEIPDGYVEPLPAVWDALLTHVRKLQAFAGGFVGLARVLSMLRDIAHREVSGRALSGAQRRWLGMVSEHVPNGGYGDTSEPPKWTGWYFDMFEDREFGAGRSAAFVADYFTLTNLNQVKYLGADGPRLGVFIVDTGGVPRAMVGPVAKGYETESAVADRLDDQRALRDAHKIAPWRASFAVPESPAPQIGLLGRVLECGGGPSKRRFALRAGRALGAVSLTLLDHHADPLGPPATIQVDGTWRTIEFSLPSSFATASFGVEALHVHVHDLAFAGLPHGAFDQMSSPSVFSWKEDPDEALPLRPKGVRDFAIGVTDAAATATPTGARASPELRR